LPCDVVHVFQSNLDLFANGEQIHFLIVGVKIHRTGQIVQLQCQGRIIVGNRIQCGANQVLNALEGKAEGVDRAFQTLEQIDAHQAANALLSSCLGKSIFSLVIQIGVLLHAAGQNVVGWSIDAQCQAEQQ